MAAGEISRVNVGRIAERIVANELEYHGFRVSDLNKEGLSANADLLAARDGRTWQIQVKGATWDRGWWFNYGYCNEAILNGDSMFNRRTSFYTAQVVALVNVKLPTEYCCVILPVEVAEQAVKINMDREYRTPKRNGEPKKPGPVFVNLDYVSSKISDERQQSVRAEQALIAPYKNNWNLDALPSGT